MCKVVNFLNFAFFGRAAGERSLDERLQLSLALDDESRIMQARRRGRDQQRIVDVAHMEGTACPSRDGVGIAERQSRLI